MSRVSLAVGAFSALLFVTLPPAAQATVAPAAAPAAVPPVIKAISSLPAAWTPTLASSGTDGTVEQVRQLVPCGDMMYAVGTFTSIRQGGTTYPRNNAFSFNATTGAVSSWNPNVNGKVNSVALTADCGTAYLGGVFQNVGGQNATNLAAVQGEGTAGAFISTFKHTADRQVSALLMSGSHLLVGGYFTVINTTSRGYFASLNPTTGDDDGYVNLNISGSYQYVDDNGMPSGPNPTRVYNFALSPDRTKLLAMGVFTSVGGLPRRQIFMLDLGALNATVNSWYSTEFDQNCGVVVPFWLQDASWAPDGSKVYIATTGDKPATGPGFDRSDPRAGLCDSAAAFPSTPGPVSHLWVNYTGCDTLFSTAADSTTVFVGGHQRWMDDANHCSGNADDTLPGPGGVKAPGMAGLSPTSGRLTFNPTRGRGIGAQDMLITPAGLWIASDNHGNTSECAGVSGRSGFCFLPYVIPKPQSDFTGDGVADRTVWRPSNGGWYVKESAPSAPKFGQSGDVPLVGDFTGDARFDIAVWRPSNGTWYVTGLAGVPFGAATDKPVPADYNGDGKTEFAVWRPSNGTWYVPNASAVQWGASGDVPVLGDFTGDGRADFSVWRPSTGNWHVRGLPGPTQWGKSGDRPVAADYTGDARPDFAVWRPSNATWYVRSDRSATPFGVPSDTPVTGDFTGDGKADVVVWRPLDGFWFVRGEAPTQWGASGDIPLRSFP